MESDLIHDRGRGPELVGTRVTVYNLLPHFLDPTATEDMLCREYDLTAEQVAAMRAYALHHYAEVMAENQKIDDRIRRGIEAQNTPEFRAYVEATRGRVEYYPTWLRDREREAADGGTPLPADGRERLREYTAWWAERHPVMLNGAAR